MYEQNYRFTFEAAHELGANVGRDPSHPYSRVHGHSFVVVVTLKAADLGDSGWIEDFGVVRAECAAVHERLDHQLLNEIPGLEKPTLENLARYIFEALAPRMEGLAAVSVARPTLGEEVRYLSA
jgi:6-pyruvoyltetrahydropterin/6-carboxytetrahydropterin synthase